MGLMAKPMLVTLPFVLLLLDYWPLGRFQLGQLVKNANHPNLQTPDTHPQWKPSIRLILEKVPFFILSAIVSVITFFVERSGGVMKTLTGYPLFYRIGNALVSYIRYIGKMFWPSHLAIFYPHPRVDLPVWQIAMALLLLVCITAAVLRRARQNPYLTVGWLWYLVTLVPVIGLVQVGLQAMADRYTYIPLIGLFIIIAWGIPPSFARLHYRKVLLSLSSLILLSALGVTAWRQVGHWRNSITLYKHAAAVVRDNWWAHNHLGTAFCRQGMLDEGIKHFTEALRIRPELPELHANLAAPLIKQGRFDEAITHLTEALQIGPDLASAHFYLGVALAEQNKPGEAVTHFTNALIIKPDFADAHLYLGVQLALQDNLDEAIVHLTEALRIKPDSADAHSNLGYALVRQGNLDEAITHFKETLRVKPDWVGPMNTLAWLLATCEQTKFHNPIEAIRLAERACELTNNENPSFLDTLAAAYAAAGKFPEAVTTAEQALKIAQSSLQRRLAEEIQSRLGLYKAGRPYIESSPKLSPTDSKLSHPYRLHLYKAGQFDLTVATAQPAPSALSLDRRWGGKTSLEAVTAKNYN